MKTASELAQEYWDKPPIERVNNTLQDYVFDYKQAEIDSLQQELEAQREETINGYSKVSDLQL